MLSADAIHAQVTDSTGWRLKLLPIAGLHVGGPVRASITSGIGLVSRVPGEPIRAFVFVEPGLRGGRLSVATGSSVGSLATAWTARASMLQLWAGAPHKRYVGLELQLIPALGIGGRVGAFRPLTGSRKILWIGDVSLLL